MLKSASTLVLSLLAAQIANADDPRLTPPVKPGQCHAYVFTKQYIDDPSTPATIHFSCDYNCVDNNGESHTVKAISSADRARSAHDGSVTVCDGATVQQVRPGVWDLKHVKAFWAKASARPEFQKWVRDHGVRIPDDDLKKMTDAFYAVILKTGQAYSMAAQTSPIFQEASLELLEIAARTEKGKQLLDSRLAGLAGRSGAGGPPRSSDDLVLNTIAAHGRFMIP